MIGRESLYIGTAGWSYPDWYGQFYPSRKTRDFNELAFFAKYFDMVEINSSYYHPQSRDASKRWLEHVAGNPRFKFTAKLWQKFVLERSLYTSEDVRTVMQGVDVLHEAGKFAGLLMQFPQSFQNTMENRSWLFRLITTFNAYPVIVEVRHNSWNKPEILEMLASRQVAFANIDQPVIGRGLPLTAHHTASIVYFRFHGRNHQMWFHENATRDQRYDYGYSREELTELASAVKSLHKTATETYVVFNNHFRGYAPKNAFELLFLLTDSKCQIPHDALRAFPELVPLSRSANPAQLELF